jgi:hypothetical protein
MQTKIESLKDDELKAKKEYNAIAKNRPDLVKYIEHDPERQRYKNKLQRITQLSYWNKATIKKEIKYEQDYDNFMQKHYDELDQIHPSMLDYLNHEERHTSSYRALIINVNYLLKNQDDAQSIVENWLHPQYDEYNDYNERRYNSNNSNNSYMGRNW